MRIIGLTGTVVSDMALVQIGNADDTIGRSVINPISGGRFASDVLTMIAPLANGIGGLMRMHV
jgi:hypothetical protein